MKKRKLTAKQRHERKIKERRERQLYQEGKVKAAAPSSRRARQKKEMQRREMQSRQYHEAHPTASAARKMHAEQLRGVVAGLLDEAYRKYYNLRQEGVLNSATALYEINLAGKAAFIYEMDVNTLRALHKQVSSWLSRSDVNLKHAKKMHKKAMDRTGTKSAEEAQNYYDMFKKWQESSDAAKGTLGSPRKFEAFRDAYKKWKASGDTDISTLFQMADAELRGAYEESAMPEPEFPGEDDMYE